MNRSSWKSFFRPQSTPKNDKRSTSRLRIESLEDRLAPATAIIQGPESLSNPNVIVILPTDHTNTVTVKYALAGGTATNQKDYTLTPGTLTFAPGERVKSIPLNIINDAIPEGNETVLIRLTAPKGVQLGHNSMLAYTIQDNDAKPTVSFSTATSQGAEGLAPKLTVNLSAASGETVKVNYAVSGGTAATGDYTLAAGTLTFKPGQTSQTILLRTLKDKRDEANETVAVTLSSPTGATLGGTPTLTYTIQDIDTAPTVAFAKASSATTEGAGTVRIPVKLSAASGLPVTVNYAVSGGSAVSGTDFTLANGTLTFAAGETTKEIEVQLIDDGGVEVGSKNLQITLVAPTNATVGKLPTHTLTINDDDPNVSFEQATTTIGEGGTTATVDVNLSTTSTKAVTVRYTLTGTATKTDYTLAAGLVTFAAGETSKTITIAVAQDVIPEANETVILKLVGPKNAVLGSINTHTLTINDDEAKPTVSFSTATSQGAEGLAPKLTVNLSAASGETVKVNYAVSGGTATTGDYTLAAGTLTFKPGQTSQTILLRTLKDKRDEANETVAVTLSSPTGATLGGTPTHTYTIQDIDTAPTVAFAKASSATTEGAGTALLQVKLSAASGLPVTVDYAISGGTAVSGTDVALAAGTLTFAAGETTKDITVNLLDDNISEGTTPKTLAVMLTAPTNATIGKVPTHTVSIKDDDPNVVFDLNGAYSLRPILVASSDTGKSNSDGVTNDNTPTIQLATTYGQSVKLFVDGTLTQQVTAEGPLEFTLAALTDGNHSITATVNDVLGHLGSGNLPLLLTVDTVAPTAPQFGLAPTSDTGTAGDQTTDAGRVTILGTTETNIDLTVVSGNLSAFSTNQGKFQIPRVVLANGANNFTIRATDLAGNFTDGVQSITRVAGSGQPNVTLQWNQATLNAIIADASAPPFASRTLAMVSAAIFDTVSALDGLPGYYVTLDAVAGSSVDAAITEAAYRVLLYLYPAQQANFDTLRNTILGGITNGASKTDGLALGQAVADAITALRQNDGWDAYANAPSGNSPGVWELTPPAYAEALTPQWANLTPFAMTSPDQFLSAAPPALDSQAYADALNEVKNLGSATSTTRTADQTQIARFWADGAGTYTPPGHWNAIASQIALSEAGSITENARLFAELNLAMADAAISSWNTKFHYNFWRPVTAIREADTDNNAATTLDTQWLPLVNTPPFPSYTSGHSTFSGAAATVLNNTYGSNYAFSTGSQLLVGVTRNFANFDAAANEAGLSRIYGGIHYSFDNSAGKVAGQAIAALVLDSFNTAADTQSPKILLARDAQSSPTNINVTGRVLDNLAGVETLEVQIDGGAFAPVAFDALGQFVVPTTFALDGSDDGIHVLRFRAKDSLGNTTSLMPFTFTLDTQAPTISVTTPTQNGNLTQGIHLAGNASATGAPIINLSYQFDSGPIVPMFFSSTSGMFDEALNLSTLSTGAHTLTVRATDAAGNIATRVLNVNQPTLTTLTVTSTVPSNGAIEVGLTVRPQVLFSRSVNTTTLNANNFYATDTTGTKLPATIVAADDGLTAWLFFTNPMPGASTITLTVDGATIQGTDGALLDAAGSGVAGSKLTTQYVTVNQAAVTDTTLTGILVDPGIDLNPGTFDDTRAGPDLVLMTADDVYLSKIANVKVYIFGRENEAVYTNASGRFTLTNVPSGNIKLVVDGNTATNPPAGFYFPEMVMDMNIRPGVVNTMMGGMGTTLQQNSLAAVEAVYLPRLQTSILKPVANVGTTRIDVDSAAAPNLTPAQRAELYVEVPANSAIGHDGQPLSNIQVGISTVPASLVREMLPPGVLQHTFDITIQAPGVAIFTKPVFISMPNMFGMAPGEKSQILSFDHTTGRLVLTGTMTVTPDGKALRSDPGSGIIHPGWHGAPPPGVQIEGNVDGPCDPSGPMKSSFGNVMEAVKNSLLAAGNLLSAALSTTGALPGSDLRIAFLSGVSLAADVITTINDPSLGNIAKTVLDVVGFFPTPLGFAARAVRGIWAAYDLYNDYQNIKQNMDQAQQAQKELARCLELGLRDDLPEIETAKAIADATYALFDAQKPLYEAIDFHGKRVTDLLAIADTTRDDLGLTSQQRSDLLTSLNASKDAMQVLGNSQTLAEAATALHNSLKAAQDAAVEGATVPMGGVAVVVNVGGNTFRTTTDSRGHWSIFVPARSYVSGGVYAPNSNRYMSFSGQTGVSGGTATFGKSYLAETNNLADTDGDGLADDAEKVLGTNPQQADTNSDGITDLASVQQGIDPLGNFPVATGLIANLPLAGEAHAVTLAGSILADVGQTAYVATGSYGLAIVNASKFKQPVLVGQIDLGGDSRDVAVDSALSLVAVASDTGGVNIVDVTNPTNPTLARTINYNSSLVRVNDGVVYATQGQEIRSFDMLTGELLQILSVGSGTITSLAREGNHLYTLDTGNVLKVVDIGGPTMLLRGSTTLTTAGGKLFVGNGIAYVGAGLDFNEGFSTVNVANPNAPAILSGIDDAAIGGLAVVANGSGLAVAVGNAGGTGPILDLVNVSDPSNTGNFLTRFNLPAIPSGIALGSGIAYIANGTGDLQVANYRAFDSLGVAPTATINLLAGADVDTNTPGIQVIEGRTLPIVANTADDVQIRNVELLVNGNVVQNSVAIPYDLAAILPTIVSNGSNAASVQVRAFDTGGNIGLSNIINLQLVPDTIPPTIINMNVTEGAVRGSQFRAITVDFDEAMDTTTLTADNFKLTGPGGTILPTNIQFRRNDTSVQLTYPTLALGAYQLTLTNANIADRVGNAMTGANIVRNFTISQYSNVWITNGNGFWDDASNWDSGTVPGFNDDVLIDVPSNPTITIRSGNVQIRSLLSNDAVTITGGTLSVAQTIQVNSLFRLAGGTIKSSTIQKGTGGQGLTMTTSGGTLDGVITQADLDLQNVSGANVSIKNGLTLDNATVHLGNTTGTSYGYMYFNANQTLGGTGTVVMGRSSSNTLYAASNMAGTLTIGSGITVRGAAGTLSDYYTATIINQGTIIADNSGTNGFDYDHSYSTNSYVYSTSNAINTSAANAAPEHVYQTVREGNASSSFSYTLDGLAPSQSHTVRLHFAEIYYSSAGQRLFHVNLNGTPVLTNFDIYATAGGNFKATVQEFTVTADANGKIVATFSAISGDYACVNAIEVLSGSTAITRIDAGIENSGSIRVQTTVVMNQGTIRVSKGATLNVSGLSGVVNGITMTGLGSELTLDGNNYILSQGVTTSDQQTLNLRGIWTLPVGQTISATNATLGLGDQSGTATDAWDNNGTITATNSVVNLGGAFTLPALGTFNRSGGTVNITGVLDNTSATLALNSSTGSWYLKGGYVKNGTYTATDGAKLVMTASGGTLDGLTASGDLDMREIVSSYVTVKNGLTLNNSTIYMGNTLGTTYGLLYFDANTTLGGTGTVYLGRSSSNYIYSSYNAAGTFTIGAGITIRGASGQFRDNYTGTIINQGTILADNSVPAGEFGYDVPQANTYPSSTSTAINTAVANAAPEFVYKSFRESNSGASFTYTLDDLTPNQSYTVRLHFAEYSYTAVGQRLFHVSLNGTQVLTNFDIFATAGGQFKANVQEFTAMADGTGKIVATFAATSGDYAMVNGIEVLSGVTPVIRINAGIENTGSITINPTAVTNQGTVEVGHGNTLSIIGLTGNLGDVSIEDTGSELIVDGSNYVINQDIAVTDQQILTLRGIWTLPTGQTISATNATLGLGDQSGTTTDTWDNNGTITATNSVVNLGGAFTLPTLGTFNRTGGIVNITGVLDNSSATLALNSSTGSWYLKGGYIKNGTYTATDGAKLVMTASGGTLDGLTASGDLDMKEVVGNYVNVKNGLTLNNASIHLGNTLGTTYGFLYFDNTQTLGGTGTVYLGRSTSNYIYAAYGAISTLTIGSGITIRGASGTIRDNYAGTIINQGTILADNSVAPDEFGYDQVLANSYGSSTAVDIDTSVTNAAPEHVYQTFRESNSGSSFAYTLDDLTPNQSYTVRLHFAEYYYTAAGQRLFGVNLNGTQVLANFDIYATAGGNFKAHVQEFNVMSDGTGKIVATFTANSGDYAMVNGIEVLSGSTAVTRINAGVVNTGNLTILPTAMNNQGTIQAREGDTLNLFGLTGNVGSIGMADPGTKLTLDGSNYILNQGVAATTGQTLELRGIWTLPAGQTISATGATLNVGDQSPSATDAWDNNGTITSTNSTVNFGGAFTVPALGTFNRTGGTVNLIGVIDNTGTTLALNNSTGSWNLRGGQIKNGTYTGADGAKIVITNYGGILDALTASGDLDMRSIVGNYVHVKNGLTLNNSVIQIGDINGNTYGYLYFDNTQTLGGTGTIIFGRSASNYLYSAAAANSTLTIGAGITIRGASGRITDSYTGSIINQGTIAADNSVADGEFGYDQALTNSYASSTSIDIDTSVANAAPESIYQTFREGNASGSFTYTLSGLTPNQSYTMRLHFAEYYYSAAGQRLFHVSLNGTQVLTNFDIFAAAGGQYIANVQDFTVSADGAGKILATLAAVSGDYAMINGLEVLTGSTPVLRINAGTVSSGNITVNPSSFTNLGTVSATNGRSLNISDFEPNAGTITAGAGGLINITGAFTQLVAGVVNIAIGGTNEAQYGRVESSGTTTLNGTLNLSITNGYSSVDNDAFQVLSFGSRVGTFAAVSGTDAGNGNTFDLTYGADNLTLTVL